MTASAICAVIGAVLAATALVLLIVLTSRIRSLDRTAELQEQFDSLDRALDDKYRSMLEEMRRETDGIGTEIKNTRQEITRSTQDSVRNLGDLVGANQKSSSEAQDRQLTEMRRQISEMARQNEQKFEALRASVEEKLQNIQEDNSRQLERMRQTVDEKLQDTLEARIGQSFKLVSERLEQVSRGLGEMQSLANGVGDLKKVLSNVKTRGILGEIQLGAILEQILTKDQYQENIATVPGSRERVEFAIRLPGDNDDCVWLPIDAKFPADRYGKLMDAYDAGDSRAIEAAGKELEAFIKTSAKSIHDKYVSPPSTTEFAIMFLPVEGLYAEVVRRGMVEVLQRDYKVNIAGPTTMAALLNSLQMGFRTLAIQRHSGQVWNILGAVKTEFGKFEDALTKAQNRINQVSGDLDQLVGTRTRAIERRLRDVEALEEPKSRQLLGDLGDFDNFS